MHITSSVILRYNIFYENLFPIKKGTLQKEVCTAFARSEKENIKLKMLMQNDRFYADPEIKKGCFSENEEAIKFHLILCCET